ncbi:hypothetical protein ABHI18_006058 [Aspergillus niger]
MASKRPEILLLCVAPRDFVGDRFEPLLERLRECADLKRATTIDEALRGLEANPKVVIVADEGVTIPVNRLVVEELEEYMRRGGASLEMEAILIKNARPKEKIYIPIKGAMTEWPRPEPVDQTQAAVVGAKVGDGYVAYCGDINPGEKLNQVILSLCGF